MFTPYYLFNKFYILYISFQVKNNSYYLNPYKNYNAFHIYNISHSLANFRQQSTITDFFPRFRNKVQQPVEASNAPETLRVYSCQLNKYFTPSATR